MTPETKEHLDKAQEPAESEAEKLAALQRALQLGLDDLGAGS